MEDKQEEENYGYGHVNDVLSEKCRDQVFFICISELFLRGSFGEFVFTLIIAIQFVNLL